VYFVAGFVTRAGGCVLVMVEISVDEHAGGAVTRDFAVAFAPRAVRFVRVHATAPVMCPGWHKGAGNRSFIFADEVVVE
jgi:hypothetical protein